MFNEKLCQWGKKYTIDQIVKFLFIWKSITYYHYQAILYWIFIEI